MKSTPNPPIDRIQTGVLMDKRLVKVLKAMAEYHDMSLGNLLEGIVLHALEGKCAFEKDSLKRIADFKRLYHMNYGARDSHRLPSRSPAGHEELR